VDATWLPTAAQPTFLPAAGEVPNPTNVTISSTTSGATICHTEGDGSQAPPTASAGTCTSGTTGGDGLHHHGHHDQSHRHQERLQHLDAGNPPVYDLGGDDHRHRQDLCQLCVGRITCTWSSPPLAGEKIICGGSNLSATTAALTFTDDGSTPNVYTPNGSIWNSTDLNNTAMQFATATVTNSPTTTSIAITGTSNWPNLVCISTTGGAGTPDGAWLSDEDLAQEIRQVLDQSVFVFHGEGYRKIWARLRHKGIRAWKDRVLRVHARTPVALTE
jgi:hypothetical protein